MFIIETTVCRPMLREAYTLRMMGQTPPYIYIYLYKLFNTT